MENRANAAAALNPVSVIANNFAAASANKMHDDAVAAEYGFSGGLVPGVGVYGYMTIPVVHHLGKAWLERGAMWAKFLKPVYDGETVRIEADRIGGEPMEIETKALNADGTVCAVGKAMGASDRDAPRIEEYPDNPLPQPEKRLPGDLEHVLPGIKLGSLEIVFDAATYQGESGELFADELVDPLPIYRGEGAVCHPAFYPSKANRILTENVDLGPWIHTESHTEHYALPQNGETVRVRGIVEDTFQKRGHEFVVLDVAFFGEGYRPLGHVKHTAIIRPAR